MRYIKRKKSNRFKNKHRTYDKNHNWANNILDYAVRIMSDGTFKVKIKKDWFISQ